MDSLADSLDSKLQAARYDKYRNNLDKSSNVTFDVRRGFPVRLVHPTMFLVFRWVLLSRQLVFPLYRVYNAYHTQSNTML